MIRIAFFGLPLAALLLLQDGHDVPLASLSRPGWPGTRRLVKKLGRAAVLSKPDVAGDEILGRVREARPDLIVSWFWTTRIPQRVLACARHGAVGVHPSLLPRHRGPDPYYWTIASGDEQAGVTAHVLDEHYDTGAILAQRRVRVDPTWDAWTLARRLDRPSLALLREVVRDFGRGEAPVPIPQDESRATEAPAPSDEDLTIRWSEPSPVVVTRVRAASPWPGALTEIGDVPLVLTRVRETDEYPRALAPGEAVVRHDGVAIVRTGTGAVELQEGRDEDDQRLDSAALALLFRA